MNLDALMNNKNNRLEEKIIKGFQWALGIGFLVMGVTILSSGGIPLGIGYLFLGAIAVPLLKLPKGFRTLAIIAGSLLL